MGLAVWGLGLGFEARNQDTHESMGPGAQGLKRECYKEAYEDARGIAARQGCVAQACGKVEAFRKV